MAVPWVRKVGMKMIMSKPKWDMVLQNQNMKWYSFLGSDQHEVTKNFHVTKLSFTA